MRVTLLPAAGASSRMRGGDMAGAREAFEWVQAEATTHGLVTQELAARTDLGALMELGGDLDGALAMHEAILSRCLEQADPMAAANAGGRISQIRCSCIRVCPRSSGATRPSTVCALP